MTTRPPAVTSNTVTVPTSEDQIRDYRQNQRRLYNLQRRISPAQRRFRRSIETQVNPEQQLEVSHSQRANMVPAEVLYSAGFQPTQHERIVLPEIETKPDRCRNLFPLERLLQELRLTSKNYELSS